MSSDPQTEPPWLWIVTGPNGAGKSSLRQYLRKDLAELPWLNPDEIAIELSQKKEISYDDGLREALGYEMAHRAEELHVKKQGFIIETTVPGFTYEKLAKTLKSEGWKIGVIGINVASPDIAISRVNRRISEGGHPATAEQTEITWRQSIANLHFLLPHSDAAFIYDNTLERPTLVASGNNGRLHMETPPQPSPFVMKLEEVLQKRSLTAPVGATTLPPIP